MKLGIVGLPNVGKSTLFNAITKAGAEAANYPFCTIEPNVGIVELPDPRLAQLAHFAWGDAAALVAEDALNQRQGGGQAGGGAVRTAGLILWVFLAGFPCGAGAGSYGF